MFGAIPASLLLEVGRSAGVMTQLSLDLKTPIWVFLEPEHITTLPECLSVCRQDGTATGMVGDCNHPSFDKTRDYLVQQGYVEDTGILSSHRYLVKHPFFVNNVFVEEGTPFTPFCKDEWKDNYDGTDIKQPYKNY